MSVVENPAPVKQGYFTATAQVGWRDILGAWRVRWGIGRHRYRVEPGLYALGQPGRQSSIIVTANYKLTFDQLRRHLSGRDLWILVLDTKGVNVWCAAGKGSFGTKELIQRISQTGLAKLVDTRQLILPQLGASGVQAHIVKAFCGFRVIYGPVRAADLPAYLDAGGQKTPEMATVRFTLADRAVLAPVEFTQTLKYWPFLVGFAVLLAMPFDAGWWARSGFLGGSWASALIMACFAFPILLPWLPGKAFSVKSLWLGIPWLAGVWGFSQWFGLSGPTSGWLAAAALPMGLAGLVYLSMNFTGSTTFTNQTGAQAEVKIAVPICLAALGLGLTLGIIRVILAIVARGSL